MDSDSGLKKQISDRKAKHLINATGLSIFEIAAAIVLFHSNLTACLVYAGIAVAHSAFNIIYALLKKE